MKLDTIYRDIYSRLALEGVEHNISYLDIIRSINDSIRQLRLDYVLNGMGQIFSTTETVYYTLKDMDYPFMGYFNLSNPLMRTGPISSTVLAANAWVTSKNIPNGPSDGQVGDLANKGDKLYKCVTDFTGINTYDKVFNVGRIRNYNTKNGLKYKKGDVVLDNNTRDYYRCVEDFTANTDISIENISEFEKLYWYEVGSSYKPVVYYPINELRQLKIFDRYDTSYGFTIVDDKVYISPHPSRFSITYIPEWEEVEDKDEELKIPDFIIPGVKSQTLANLGSKIGVDLQQNQRRPTIRQDQDDSAENEQRRQFELEQQQRQRQQQ